MTMNPSDAQTQVLRFSPVDLGLSADWVIQGQGMDPHKIRQRRPALADLAEEVLQAGLPQLAPQVILRTLEVRQILHNQITLADGAQLKGAAVIEHLAPARQITVMAFTIGPAVEEMVFSLEGQDKVKAFAWDGLANAAVDALGGLAYHVIEQSIQSQNWQLSLVLSPGMAGWSVEDGQPQIAKILDLAPIGVKFTPEWVMLPRKSSTAVVGAGTAMTDHSRMPCDYCTMQGVCRYRGQLAHGNYAVSS